ncbi:hypothetical protein L3Y34_000504 [Caenorhabditis briggsae]|uniref:Uncharacterized protein n=1 Tax=Caenorhabditis briggsae TaxID=6238 RepID=A0AAE9D9K5_CAEBR|nr:hypothetical protein L3Y34_000504 [Caenorhabditis briggsae]
MVLFSKVRSGTDSETCTKSDEKRKRAGNLLHGWDGSYHCHFINCLMGCSQIFLAIFRLVHVLCFMDWINDIFPEYFTNFYNIAVHFCFWISFFIYNLVIIIVYGVRISNVRDSLAEIVGDGAPVVAEVNRWLTPFFGITITMLLLTLLVALLIFRMTFYCYKNR